MSHTVYTNYSAFGGRLLKHLPDFDASYHQKLAALGVHDAEQLLGIVAALGGTKELAETLGLSADEISSALATVTESVPKHLVEKLSHAHHIKYALGALEHTEKSRADTEAHLAGLAVLSTAPPASLPSSVNHAALMNQIQNQGSRGTCVSFGSSAMHEYLLKTHGTVVKFAEEFIYDEAKKIDGQPNLCGTWLVYAVKVLNSLGQCLETTLPYNPNLPCNHPNVITPGILKQAASYKSAPHMLANPKDVNAIKTALAANSNVPFCIPVYNSWYQSPTVAKTGQITMPLNGEQPVGGHCMCLIGYQDNAASPGGGYFILRNSWGTGWAYQDPYGAGNGTIPYQYIAQYCTESASY